MINYIQNINYILGTLFIGFIICFVVILIVVAIIILYEYLKKVILKKLQEIFK